MTSLNMRAEFGSVRDLIVELSAAAEALPEFGKAILDLFDAGEELFLLHTDQTAAPLAGEVVVRFYPSDSLLGLMAAFRARQAETLLFEHWLPQVGKLDCSTTSGHMQ